MVKRKKHDKDKYYSLARQQGYRARSAFKLIQLNKKYDFLSSAKVCIDLCAAPGGWCQVAAKYMPVSSIILGIDLLPIRPIRNVKTFVCDITTQKCRQIIKQELQTWQADVVLCDGAPNVGAEYSKDAFVQNELALIAMKLAVEVLGRGGTFVTKVFRSQDYNALLWVFKQLFKKVSATKPLSSRNESAEIFVVCEEFLAPHSIDPKLLDPKHVFQQIDEEKKDGLTIFHPKYGQQKKHRQGYDDNLGVSLRNKVSVSEFICTSDPIRMLTDATEIEFTEDDSLFKDHKETTEEIKICLGDLKVLGKGDFKRLLKWRSKMMNYRNEILKEEKESCSDEADAKPAVEKEKVEMTQDEKDAVVREELALLRSAVNAKKRRQKKKEAEKKAKLRVRASIGMDLEGVDPGETEQVFSMSQLGLTKSKADVLENEAASTDDEIETGEHSGNDCDDYDETVDRQMDELYDSYLANAKDGSKTKKAIKRSKIAKRALAGESLVQDQALYDGDAKQYKEMLDIENSSDDSSSEEETSNKLVVDFKDEQKSSVVVSRWFSSNPLFKDVKTEFSDQSEKTTTVDDDGDIVPVMPMTEKEKRKIKRRKLIDRKDKREKRQQEMEEEEENLLSYNSQFEIAKAGDKINSQSTDDEKLTPEELKARDEKRKLIRDGMGKLVSEDKPSNKFEVVKNDDDLERFDDRTYDSDSEDYDDEDRARTLAIGQLMLRKSKQKEMIDSSYNRYAWNDQADLPDWFLDDEEKHYRPQVPIPKNILDQMKQKFLEMASKPVKKVAEARNRKKRQEMKKAKAAKKKANEIANLPDMSTREKLKAIEKAMGKSKIQKQEKVYVVSRRGGRSNGTKNTSEAKKKGRVKLVDSRMKSDKRGLEKKEKDKKRGRKRKR